MQLARVGQALGLVAASCTLMQDVDDLRGEPASGGGAGQDGGGGSAGSFCGGGAGGAATWQTLGWKPGAPFGNPLPGAAASETDYLAGGANMSENVLLWQFD